MDSDRRTTRLSWRYQATLFGVVFVLNLVGLRMKTDLGLLACLGLATLNGTLCLFPMILFSVRGKKRRA